MFEELNMDVIIWNLSNIRINSTQYTWSDEENRFGLGSGVISMSPNTWDPFINYVQRLDVERYDFLTIFRSSGLFLVKGPSLSADVNT